MKENLCLQKDRLIFYSSNLCIEFFNDKHLNNIRRFSSLNVKEIELLK